ncbi:hypothetical protein [Micromonospora coxensis]|uniref:DUF998 domain-containing protein n=1 Tax=Micromonospora coxensis TaxID=356852 RepID=A0A1C5H3Q6_9ACTN|nr:hypothetical protein [Micromonospora coxensis]SCG40675.1 hypothetical protein GA0070614_0778 [Micromonospora coxensis]
MVVSQDMLTVRRLRLGVGVVGIALPFVLTGGHALVVGRPILLDSVSGAYHTAMRDVFVGSMCAIGVFLICYRYRRLDDLLSSVAGALSIAVALLPTAPGSPTDAQTLVGRLHQVCAAALFLILAGFCLLLFTRTDPTGAPTPEKLIRNRVYRVCGWLIVAAIVVAVASTFLPDAVRDAVKPVFWCETVAVLAFGAAWLVKGEAIIRDGAGGAGDPGRSAAPA